jgi:hypothetical protein
MLFAIFALSVITLELIMRYDAKSGIEKTEATPAPFAAPAGDTITADLICLAQALAGDSVTPRPELERLSSSHSAASPRGADGRSS